MWKNVYGLANLATVRPRTTPISAKNAMFKKFETVIPTNGAIAIKRLKHPNKTPSVKIPKLSRS